MHLLLSLLIPAFAWGAPCDERPTEILTRNSKGHTAVWVLRDSAALQARLQSNDRNYVKYLRWVRSNTGMDARQLLQNHIEAGRRISAKLSPGDQLRDSIDRAEVLAKKILNGRLGRIQKISCLEGLAFIEFLRVADLRRKSIEFNVTVLKKGGQLVMIGDFYSSSRSGGAAGVSESSAAGLYRRQLMRQGHSLAMHLHNHPFSFDNPYGDIGGGVMPSDPDFDVYDRLNPREARVTNGIESFVLKP